MFEGDSADTCAEKFPLVSMRGQAEGLACTDPGARTPIGASGHFYNNFFILIFLFMLLESPLKNLGPYDKSSWDIFEIRQFSGQNRVN